MALCPVCDRLVFIKQRGYKHAGSRERWWFAVDHDDQTGTPCPGTKKGI